MNKLRLIARLDVKNEHVIKGIHLEGLRKVGDPVELAKKYYEDGVDEIVFMDAVASLYGRNNLFDIISRACEKVFIPITIGGGIRDLNDIELALKSGADKVAINTAAIRNNNLIKEASRIWGSQCIVGSIEAKFKAKGKWEAFVDNGREETGLDAVDWASKLVDLGVGELMVTSIDMEGTKKGFDIELLHKINNSVDVPVIAAGGYGRVNHIIDLYETSKISGVALASILHYSIDTCASIKHELNINDINVRVL